MRIKIFAIVITGLSFLNLFLPFVKKEKSVIDLNIEPFTNNGFDLILPIIGVTGILLISTLVLVGKNRVTVLIYLLLSFAALLWGVFTVFVIYVMIDIGHLKMAIGTPIYSLTILLIFALSILDYRQKRKSFKTNKSQDLLDDF